MCSAMTVISALLPGTVRGQDIISTCIGRPEVKCDEDLDFDFQNAEIVGDEISFYNGASFHMMTTSGKKRFDGSYMGSVQDIFSMGDQKYIVVGENSLEELELK